MDSNFDYELTEKALSAMWGMDIVFAKPGEKSVSLTPLNQHLEGFILHEKIDDASSPLSEIIQISKEVKLKIDTNVINPQYDYDFTSVVDTQKFYRGSLEYKRPIGYKRIGINVKGIYDKGHNGWMSMKANEGVWVNSYVATDNEKLMNYLNKQDTFIKLCKSVYSFDIGIASFPDISIAEQFGQIVEIKGSKYIFLLQCRVNPKTLKACCNDDVIVSPKESIRPYGILVKKIY